MLSLSVVFLVCKVFMYQYNECHNFSSIIQTERTTLLERSILCNVILGDHKLPHPHEIKLFAWTVGIRRRLRLEQSR